MKRKYLNNRNKIVERCKSYYGQSGLIDAIMGIIIDDLLLATEPKEECNVERAKRNPSYDGLAYVECFCSKCNELNYPKPKEGVEISSIPVDRVLLSRPEIEPIDELELEFDYKLDHYTINEMIHSDSRIDLLAEKINELIRHYNLERKI